MPLQTMVVIWQHTGRGTSHTYMRSHCKNCQACRHTLSILKWLHTLSGRSEQIHFHSHISGMPATNPSSQDWDRCCASDLGEKPNLNHVFTIYTWEAGLYSSSIPEARQVQRNTTIGRDLIPRTVQDTSRAQSECQTHNIPSLRSCNKAHPGLIKTLGNTGVWGWRSAHLNYLLSLRSRSFQITHGLLWKERMIIYSILSHTYPKRFAFLCSVHLCAHEQRKAVQL